MRGLLKPQLRAKQAPRDRAVFRRQRELDEQIVDLTAAADDLAQIANDLDDKFVDPNDSNWSGRAARVCRVAVDELDQHARRVSEDRDRLGRDTTAVRALPTFTTIAGGRR